MKTFIAFVCTLAAAYTGTMMVIAPSEADAADRRVGAGYCHDSSSTTSIYNGSWFNNPNNWTLGIYCTMPSDAYLNTASVNTLNIHGSNDVGSAATVKACATDWTSAGTTCGAATTTTSGHFNTTVADLWAWQAAGHYAWFPFVYVTLPPNSKINGFWMST